MNIFNSEGSAVLESCALQGLRIYFIGFLFAAVNIIKAGYFSATNAPRESFVIAISRGVVSIVAFAFILSAIFGGYRCVAVVSRGGAAYLSDCGEI